MQPAQSNSPLSIIGYSDKLSVAPGEVIRFHVSCAYKTYQVELVRLIHGIRKSEPGFKTARVDASMNRTYPGKLKDLRLGSCVIVPDVEALRLSSSFSLQAWILPTLPGRLQGILTKWLSDKGIGYGLFLEEKGDVSLRIGHSSNHFQLRTGTPLRMGEWYFVSGTFDADSGQVTVQHVALRSWTTADKVIVSQRVNLKGAGPASVPLLIGAFAVTEAGGDIKGHFNGKIDSPCVYNCALSVAQLDAIRSGEKIGDPVAFWDFSLDYSSTNIIDTSLNRLNGVAINSPTRAATGHNWSGSEVNASRKLSEYGAIHFHDDDFDDAGWAADFSWLVPVVGIASGIYAAHIFVPERGKEAEDFLPFVIRPMAGTATASIAFLVPTLTYLAYANEHMPLEPKELYPFLDTSVYERELDYILKNRLHSLYDVHADRSGVCYASWRRPLVNFRPDSLFCAISSAERLSADLCLIDWLIQKGFQYDTIADENLHAEGVELLKRYKVILTGSHPEYYTAAMLKALEQYLQQGGRVMYLGGNGFYWVTSIDPERPHLIEVRRWGGTETWAAAPGEYYHSTTGELGGLWRNRGAPPQQLVGVGFTANGNDYARPYAREQGGFDPRAAFVFEGIKDEELIGDFPSLVLRHGAAGYEIDRADRALGTPPHALVLASARGFSNSYQHVVEELLNTDDRQGGPTSAFVRSDMVFFETPNNGAVFSVGSIAWCGCLSHNSYGNNVSRVTENVLRKFAELPKH